MARFFQITHHFFILYILSFFPFVHATPNLDPFDLGSLLIIQRDLGVNGQPLRSSSHPCNTPGLFCERRLSPNNTYILRITGLVFKSSQLTGFLSPAIGRLTELKELSVSNNTLVDRIPPQIVDCRKLEVLDLANNKFVGEVPPALSSLVRLRILDLSSNKFSGNLNFLKNFPNLESLSIADNLFTGRIPKSILSFRNLRSFNYSGNQFLEGSAPIMKRVQYSTRDVPKRFVLAENSAERSNRIPAGAPTPTPNPRRSFDAEAPSPVGSPPHKNKSKRKKVNGWIVGFTAGAVAGTISGLLFSFLFRLALALIKGGGKHKGISIYSPLIKKPEDLAFLEKDDGLASLEIIGRGGCGEVYLAELPGSDGKHIAIKKIIQPSKDASELSDEDSKQLHKKMRQIQSEIKTVGQIRHRNLLPLLAHVSRTDCHYLVYEFMKNGSLQDVLNQVQDGHRDLDWMKRYNIALGVASGLEYLHILHTPRIIHRDLKPGNILLDDDMEPRIADFGLAKAMPDAQTHITTSNVAGTVGYIAPEYHQIFKFTEKCDIYSFGVLLGVLVIGKLPSDPFFTQTEPIGLVKWMRDVIISEEPKKAIDPKLMGNGYEEQMLLVLKIACFCTVDEPKERPNGKDVRCMLTQIKH